MTDEPPINSSSLRQRPPIQKTISPVTSTVPRSQRRPARMMDLSSRLKELTSNDNARPASRSRRTRPKATGRQTKRRRQTNVKQALNNFDIYS